MNVADSLHLTESDLILGGSPMLQHPSNGSNQSRQNDEESRVQFS